MYIRLLFAIFLFVHGAVLAQNLESTTDSAVSTVQDPYINESVQDKKYFSKEDWENAKNGINYEPYKTQKPKELEKQKPTQEKETPSLPWFNFSGMRYVFYVIVIGLLIAFLVWLARDMTAGGIAPKLSQVTVETQEQLTKDELILLDLEAMIPKAIQNKDFYLATRLLYLKVLQKFVILQLIEWRKDQTNRSILGQLPSEEMQWPTRTIFRQYETVWYGQKAIIEQDFYSYQNQCDQLVSLLQSTKKK